MGLAFGDQVVIRLHITGWNARQLHVVGGLREASLIRCVISEVCRERVTLLS